MLTIVQLYDLFDYMLQRGARARQSASRGKAPTTWIHGSILDFVAAETSSE